MSDRTPDKHHPPELAGRHCMIATRHQKESVIGPLLEARFGVNVEVPTDFNTDQFGTFAGEVERVGSQLEAARAKARAAMKATGANLVVASEGSFSPHPVIPLLSQQIELVVLIDDQNQHEVYGQYVSAGNLAKHQKAKSAAEVVAIAKSWGFPSQGVILKTSPRKIILKDLDNEANLYATAESLLKRFFVREIILETDLRAHRCPGRRTLIKEAAQNLINTYLTRCPRCTTPGYCIKESQPGLPCSQCGLPTNQTKSYLYCCKRCQFCETKAAEKTMVDPGDCAWCNP